METTTLDYERTWDTVMSTEDRRYLRFLEIAHLIGGAIILVPFTGVLGLGLCLIPMHGLADEPGVSGLGLALRTLAIGGSGAALGAAICLSARRMRARTHRRFSTIIAGVQIVLGTAVLASAAVRALNGRRSALAWAVLAALLLPMILSGLMTLLVLTRESVRAAYAQRAIKEPGTVPPPTVSQQP